jgi:hypothetical protein
MDGLSHYARAGTPPPSYFNALLIRRGVLRAPQLVREAPFPDSAMGRALLSATVTVEGTGQRVELLTSHLESLDDEAKRQPQRRCRQLGLVLDRVASGKADAWDGKSTRLASPSPTISGLLHPCAT